MSVRSITTEELRRMWHDEGLILQGCGGDPQEWVDGINSLLTESGILQDGTRFHDCSTFAYKGITCLLFPFEDDVKVDVGRLAMWRLQTHGAFYGTWLSDFVYNHLGGFAPAEPETQKPDCPLIGQDGNIFNLMGLAARTLRRAGLDEQAKEMCDRIRGSGSYDQALGIIGEYVNITSVDDMDEDEGEGMEMGM